jgi:hypothetical protein
MAQWWTRLQEGSAEERATMADAIAGDARAPRQASRRGGRRRRRRPKAAAPS